jgi:hypothetical protein
VDQAVAGVSYLVALLVRLELLDKDLLVVMAIHLQVVEAVAVELLPLELLLLLQMAGLVVQDLLVLLLGHL